MIRNYLKTALRNFRRHRSFTFLNIMGLAIGIAASILILHYVKYERSFDTFHSKADDIYRVQYNTIQNGSLTFECAAAVPAVGPELRDNFPEVLQYTRLFPIGGVVTYEDGPAGPVTFRETRLQVTDPAVFEIFDFQLVKGDYETCLEGPGKAVISSSAASRYFGEEDPIGKQIRFGSNWEFEVTGVVEDVPDNSHIKFDFLLSFQTIVDRWGDGAETSWGWYDFNTYVNLEPGTNFQEFQNKWNDHLYEVRGESWEKYSYKQEFILQPLLDIHLGPNLLQESEPAEKGDSDSVYFLTIIAFFILIIAWVNYVNLSTAKSFERANEVGVRKVMGAYRGQIQRQFFAEAVLINLFALIIGIGIVLVSWPAFAKLTGRPIPFAMITDAAFWLIAGLLFFVGTIFSGFYPALVLSSFKPISVLKGKISVSSGGTLLRKGLVVFQFFMSILLISGTLIVFDQLNFMKNTRLGFDMVETLVVEGPGVTDSLYTQKLEGFKNEALKISGIAGMTVSSNVPGDEIFWTRGVKRLTGGPESSLTSYIIGIDYDYVPSFDLEVLAGRNFSEDFPSDETGVIVNRSFVERVEFENSEEAIGQQVTVGGDTLEIVGVLEDYHQMSLKSSTAPLVFVLTTSSSFFAFKLDNSNYQDVLGMLQEPWDAYFPGNPVDYFFLDEFFNKQYDADSRFGRVFGLFSILAIFVACLGLFGLASFMTNQRTKEIGIRKALGSSVNRIVVLLSGGFVKLVIVGTVLAIPVSWIIMNDWLETFPYHTVINPLTFLFASLLAILIALLSVGFQTIRAALLNPAKTLRYE